MHPLAPALLLLLLTACEQASTPSASPPEPAPQARPEPPPVRAEGQEHSEDPIETVRQEIANGEIPRSLPGRLEPEDQATLEGRIREQVAAGKPLSSLYRPAVTSPAFIATLGIGPDEVVADIGAGTGGLELALLEQGVPFGSIHAVDVSAESLDLLQLQLDAARLPGSERVAIVRSQPTDVELPAGTIDRALIINVSSFNAEQGEQGLSLRPEIAACLGTLAEAMKPGAELLAYYEAHVHGDGSVDPLLVEGVYDEGDTRPVPPQQRDGYVLFEYPAPSPAQRNHLHRFAFPYEQLGFEITSYEMIVVDGMTYTRIAARKP
jgi:SAM-dependent methyltransferase